MTLNYVQDIYCSSSSSVAQLKCMLLITTFFKFELVYIIEIILSGP